MDKMLLTPCELAETLGLKEQTIYNRNSLKKPLPPAIKLGRLLRFPTAGVIAWLSEQEEQSAAMLEDEKKPRKRGRPTKAALVAHRNQIEIA